jgi:PAS domain S-box-containing protein
MSLGRPSGWEPAFWAVFERTRNAMTLLDEERRVVDANSAMIDLLGYTREEMVGRSIFEFIPRSEHAAADRAWFQFRAAGEQTMHRTLLRKDGRKVGIQYAGVHTELPDRGPLGVYVAIAVDDGPEVKEELPEGESPPELTPREVEIVKLVALGYTGGEIASELRISAETVRSHVRNAMDKTGTHTRAQLVATAFAERLIAR